MEAFVMYRLMTWYLGYIGNYAILETIEHFVQKLKATNPDLVYGKLHDKGGKIASVMTHGSFLVCDPVMGDWGRLYVAQEIVPLYRNIMRISDVATPNQFEAEQVDIKWHMANGGC